MPEAYVAWVTPRGGSGAKVLVRSPELHPRLQHAIPTPFPRLPRPSEKPGEADPFRLGRTSLSRQEVGGGERAGKKKKQKRTSRACVVLWRPLVWSRVAGFGAPAGVRLRGRRVFSTAPPPQSPLPLPLSPVGALGPAPGPCSPVPAPVGFIWRLISGRIICLDLKDTFCSSLLIYNFRIFERRYGSRKFASFLLGSWVLSAVGDFILVEAVGYSFGVTAARNLPSGFLAPVFALFVPFYCSIPRVQVAHILGPLSITNKTLIYILGLQVSGICYNSRMLQVHEVLYVPSWMAKFCAWTLEPLFSSSEPTSEARVGMGATVDIQRQQRMELLDRQLMLSQFAQVRRQRQQQGGMINWNRLFPPLRQRRNVNYQDGRRSEQPASPPLEVSEEQVARLMEMGFSRGDALEALRASNNDLNVATHFLLQH
ncbi:ubiquitin-associated domain-containing protein 2 isoform X1 [Odocoileus virginianus]|uniref:Ubiquitin-associated domain-containing protein 2 isoform X1 n=1 Tax=Odocoileus virginianus TaxID=9874 RepID=A0ABM4IIB3_ODOVR